MSVRLIRCRNTETGAEADIPETGLQHLRAYEPIDPADRPTAAEEQPGQDPAGDNSEAATPAADTPKSKTATGGKDEEGGAPR